MLAELFLERWQQVRAGLVTTVELFEETELSYAPFAGGYSVRELVLHIANEEEGEIHCGITRSLADFPAPYDPGAYPDRAAVLTQLDAVHRRTLDYLRSLDDGDLAREVETPWGMRARQIELLWHVLEHETHHRGELSLMAGLLGRKGLDV